MKQILSLILFYALFVVLMVVITLFVVRQNDLSGINRVGSAYLYPSISGETNLAVSQATIQQTICVKGWTATIRPPVAYTTSLKVKQLRQLGLSDQNTADYEEDHFISLELGGSPTSTLNLWPEAYQTPYGIGARQKDKVETSLKVRICSGALTLKQAQNIITGDWVAEYQRLSKNLGGTQDILPSETDD